MTETKAKNSAAERWLNRFEKPMNMIQRACQTRPKLALAAFFSVSVLLIFWNYLFGIRYFAFLDIGNDTVNIIQPGFFAIADDLAAGRTAQWTFNYGLGCSVLTYLATCVDPFVWPTLLARYLGSFRAAEISLAWMQGLKFLLCALICYDFLKEFKVRKAANMLTSYIYGFGGFLVLWGQQYEFSSNIVIFSLMILLIERAIKHRGPSGQHALLALTVAWLVAKSYYFGYMSLLMAAVYTMIRLFCVYPIRSVKAWVSAGSLVLLSVLLGILASCALFLPQVHEVLAVSDRIQHSTVLTDLVGLVSKKQAVSILNRYLSNNLEGIWGYSGYGNYYEAEQLFFSSFMVFFAALYVLLGRHEGRRTFVLRLVATVALLALPMLPVTGFVFNGFVTPFGRYTFVFMPFYAIVTAKALTGIWERRLARRDILVAAVLFALLLLVPRPSRGSILLLYVSIVLEFVILVASMLLYNRSKRWSRAFATALVLVVAVNVAVDTWFTNNHRRSLSDEISDAQIQEMTSSVKKINEGLREVSPEMFRVEKSYSDYSRFNDALVEDYYGISYYNNIVSGGVKAFFYNCWDEIVYLKGNAGYVQFERDLETPEKAALLGVKYLISREKDEPLPGYRYIGTEQGRKLYENEHYRGFGQFFCRTSSYEAFLSRPEEERDGLLWEALLLDEPRELPEASGSVSIRFPESEDHLEGTVNCDGEGYVFLPIPYDEGWKVSLNGEAVEPLRADYGFIALPVEAGTTDIALDYHIPLLNQGMILSLIGFLGILGMAVVGGLFGRRKKRESTPQH